MISPSEESTGDPPLALRPPHASTGERTTAPVRRHLLRQRRHLLGVLGVSRHQRTPDGPLGVERHLAAGATALVFGVVLAAFGVRHRLRTGHRSPVPSPSVVSHRRTSGLRCGSRGLRPEHVPGTGTDQSSEPSLARAGNAGPPDDVRVLSTVKQRQRSDQNWIGNKPGWRRWDSNPRPPACKAGALAN